MPRPMVIAGRRVPPQTMLALGVTFTGLALLACGVFPERLSGYRGLLLHRRRSGLGAGSPCGRSCSRGRNPAAADAPWGS